MLTTNTQLKGYSKLMNEWDGVKHAYINHEDGRTRIETSLKELTTGSNEISVTALKLIKRYDFKAWQKIMDKGVKFNYKHWTIEWKALKTTTRFSILNTKTGDVYSNSEARFNIVKAMNELTDKAILNLVIDMVLYGTVNQSISKNAPYKKVSFHEINWTTAKVENK